MVITVSCPSCHTSFPVDPAKIPEKGVKARCSECSEVFRVERPSQAERPVIEATPPAPAEPPVQVGQRDAASRDDDGVVAAAATQEPVVETPVRSVDAEVDAPLEPAAEAAAGDPNDWVIETDDHLDAGGMDIPAMEVEPNTPMGSDESAFFGGGASAPPPTVEDVVERPVGLEPGPGTQDEDAGDFQIDAGDGAAGAPAAAEEDEVKPIQGFTFGQRDPKDKARRLARVLVSDMIMYNPQRHEQALANGTLKEDFEEEIEKSWKEYVEQVGEEMAEGNDFWREALNDVLAKGQQMF